MVRKLDHKVVAGELEGNASEGLLNTMNKAFTRFGVLFTNSNITNVTLPRKVAELLQRITKLDEKLEQHRVPNML